MTTKKEAKDVLKAAAAHARNDAARSSSWAWLERLGGGEPDPDAQRDAALDREWEG